MTPATTATATATELITVDEPMLQLWSNLDFSPVVIPEPKKKKKKRKLKYVMKTTKKNVKTPDIGVIGELAAGEELGKLRRGGAAGEDASENPSEVEWETEQDKKVCPICEPLDGQLFESDAPDLPALPAHPNCRCVLVDVETGDVVVDAADLEAEYAIVFGTPQTEFSVELIGGIVSNAEPTQDTSGDCTWVTLRQGQRVCLGDGKTSNVNFEKGMTKRDVKYAKTVKFGNRTVSKGDVVTFRINSGHTRQLLVEGFDVDESRTRQPAVWGTPVMDGKKQPLPQLASDANTAGQGEKAGTIFEFITDIRPKSEVLHMLTLHAQAMEDQECTWVTIHGHPVCLKDRSDKEREQKQKPDKYMQKMEATYGKNKGKGDVYVKEKIVLSDKPSSEHIETGEKVATMYPQGKGAEFYSEQARKADAIRASAEDVALKNLAILKKDFPDEIIGSRLKDTYSAVEKTARKNIDDVSELHDIIGARIVTANGKGIAETRAIAEQIRDSGKFRILKYEDVLDTPKNDMGLRSAHIDFMDEKTGMITELQVRTERQERWSDYVHDRIFKLPEQPELYEKIKDNKEEFTKYSRAISDYYHELDSGRQADINTLKRPPCPPIVAGTIGCIE